MVNAKRKRWDVVVMIIPNTIEEKKKFQARMSELFLKKRESLGISQRAFADRIKVSPTYISGIERKNVNKLKEVPKPVLPSSFMLNRMIKGLNIDPRDIFDYEDENLYRTDKGLRKENEQLKEELEGWKTSVQRLLKNKKGGNNYVKISR